MEIFVWSSLEKRLVIWCASQFWPSSVCRNPYKSRISKTMPSKTRSDIFQNFLRGAVFVKIAKHQVCTNS